MNVSYQASRCGIKDGAKGRSYLHLRDIETRDDSETPEVVIQFKNYVLGNAIIISGLSELAQ